MAKRFSPEKNPPIIAQKRVAQSLIALPPEVLVELDIYTRQVDMAYKEAEIARANCPLDYKLPSPRLTMISGFNENYVTRNVLLGLTDDGVHFNHFVFEELREALAQKTGNRTTVA